VPYHEAFWATAGGAAPVLALAHGAAIAPLVREGLARTLDSWRETERLYRRFQDADDHERIEIAKIAEHLRSPSNRAVQAAYKLDRARTQAFWVAGVGLGVAWWAFFGAIDSLAKRQDLFTPLVAVVLLTASVGLLMVAVISIIKLSGLTMDVAFEELTGARTEGTGQDGGA
jgi:hypothetical protein